MFAISALNHEGTRELVFAINSYLSVVRAQAKAEAEAAARAEEEARAARRAAVLKPVESAGEEPVAE